MKISQTVLNEIIKQELRKFLNEAQDSYEDDSRIAHNFTMRMGESLNELLRQKLKEIKPNVILGLKNLVSKYPQQKAAMERKGNSLNYSQLSTIASTGQAPSDLQRDQYFDYHILSFVIPYAQGFVGKLLKDYSEVANMPEFKNVAPVLIRWCIWQMYSALRSDNDLLEPFL